MSSRTLKPVLRQEDFNAAFELLLEAARQSAGELRQQPGRVSRSHPDVPDVTESLEAALKESLEDEIVLAVPTDADGSVDADEVKREVMKKALAGLKLSALRRLAGASGLSSSGQLEAVAERLGRHYRWDNEEIARLILANEEEPSEERGLVSRLFVLRDVPDLDDVSDRVGRIGGRYVRTGVARWFIFSDSMVSDQSVRMDGVLRTYHPEISDFDDVAKVSASEHEVGVATLLTKSPVLEVMKGTALAARASLAALRGVAGLEPLGHVPSAEVHAPGRAGSLHPASEFLLDLLFNRLASKDPLDLNLTVARFNVGPGAESESAVRDDERPSLQAVRFEGRHLLDSVEACRLLTVEARAMTEIAFHLRRRETHDGIAITNGFSLRVSIEADHVVVATGLGTARPEATNAIHREVVSAIRTLLEHGLGNRESIGRLESRIRARATSGEVPNVPSMLARTATDET